MRASLPLLLLPLLAACAAPGEAPNGLFPGLFPPGASAEPPEPEPLPPFVLAALPPGVPASVVLRDDRGCYLYTIERTEPPSGYPLRDAAGNPICDGVIPAVAPLAAPLGAPSAVTVTPLAADGSFQQAEVFSTTPPESLAPLPTTPPVELGDAGAPIPPPAPVSANPSTDTPLDLAPGSIVPPAPLAPLN